ncbi:hypothetical protein EJ082_15655 [Brevundimonas diminuta]|nr:hypothetical protein [Brevundimonas diminuta]MBD3574402.1 hypothetical protein [Brevundimonas diminuta]GEC01559.1 hypothetical protein BDI01nite_26230 [Brevundimonas diminuta]
MQVKSVLRMAAPSFACHGYALEAFEMLRKLERRAGPFAVVAMIGIVAAGTYAQFALPYYRGGAEPAGCYFYDALFIGVRCAPDMPGMFAGGLTISWYLTWGVYWLALSAEMPPFLGVPVLGLWGLVIRSGARWIWSKRSQPALHP